MPALKPKEPQRLIFDSFVQGIISRLPPERIDINAMADAQSIALNEKFVPTKALGQIKYNATGVASYPVTGMFLYTASDGTKYYIKACGGKIWYSVAGTGTYTAFQVTLDSGLVDMTVSATAQFEFAQYNNKLYIVNGNYPIITNNSGTDHAFTTSGIIVIQIINSVVYVNAITDMPAAATGLQYIIIHKERLVGFNAISYSSIMVYTNTFFDYTFNAQVATMHDANNLPSIWVPSSGANYDTIGKDDGEVGCAIYPFNNCLYLFKETNVYQYSTVGDITNWGKIKLDTRYGCPFNRTIQDLDGYMYWFSLEGIIRCDGTNVDLIDDNVRNRIAGFSTQSLPQMSSRSRQWTQGQSPDFNAGTFGADIIDITDGMIKQNSEQATFPKTSAAYPSFGDELITVPLVIGASGFSQYIITLKSQYLAADWNAGTLSDTEIVGNAVQLGTTSVQTPTPSTETETVAGLQVNQFWTTYDFGADRVVNYVYSPGAGANWRVSHDNITYYQTTGDVQAVGGAYQGGNYRFWQYRGSNTPNGQTLFFYDPNHYWGYKLTVTQHTSYDLGIVLSAKPNFTVVSLSDVVVAGAWYYSDDPTDEDSSYHAGTSGAHQRWRFISSTVYTDNTYGYGLDSGIAIAPQYNITQNASLFNTGSLFNVSYTIYTNVATTVFKNSGTFITQSLDYGFTPTGYLIFTATSQESTPKATSGTTISYETSTSSDNSNWDNWVSVSYVGQITSTLKRYIRVRVTFASSTGVSTMILNTITLGAPYISKILDYGSTPISFGNFCPDINLNGGSILFYTRSSANSDMSSPTAWTAIQYNDLISITLHRYFQWMALINPKSDGTNAPQINGVYIAAQWDSAVFDIGSAPAATWTWGNLSAVSELHGQTLTYWMRSGTTSGSEVGTGVLVATWVQQTPGTPVTGLTLSRYMQLEVRLNTTDATQIPAQEGFNVVWYNLTPIVKPCAYVFNKEYGLNLAGVGSSINNILWKYVVQRQALSSTFVNTTGFFLYRTNKYNNIYFVDERILLSGTSQSDGFTRLNETGNDDDGVPIDSWFLTKNVEQGIYKNMFRTFIVSYRSDQPWAVQLIFDTQTVTVVIPSAPVATTLRKTLPGLVLGHFVQLMCEQVQTDANWQVSEMALEFDQGYALRND